MRDILTVTLNPAIDLDSATASVTPGQKLRCSTPRRDPGGGGINISRALVELGVDSTALVALGGAGGEMLRGLLERAGLTVAVLPAPGETRQNLCVTDQGSGAQYRFIFPGPDWRAEDVARARIHLENAVPRDGIVVLSGSQPAGFDAGFPAALGAVCAGRGAGLVLDSSGPALHAIAAGRVAGLELLRLDQGEARELAGRELPDVAASLALAADLVARRVARIVALARGPEGTVMATDEGAWFCKAAEVPVRSKTGAGDSFVAGFVKALAGGELPEMALQCGVAAASAAVMTPGTDLCRRADVRALMPACPVTRQ